nr:ilvB operon leader peptide IvbL [Proteus penneri]
MIITTLLQSLRLTAHIAAVVIVRVVVVVGKAP